MSAEITHRAGAQIVGRGSLRRVLRAAGERCYCAPDRSIEWDAGRCPQHDVDTRQAGAEAVRS